MSTPVITTIAVEHMLIPSAKTFEETKAALESSIQELDMAPIKAIIDSGDHEGAVAALDKLPPLNIFTIRPRNVGPLLPRLHHDGKATQYEIGNPQTAMRMTRHEPGVGAYFPIRVLLREKSSLDGAPAAFEYDRPVSTIAQFKNQEVQALAVRFDGELEQALRAAAAG